MDELLYIYTGICLLSFVVYTGWTIYSDHKGDKLYEKILEANRQPTRKCVTTTKKIVDEDSDIHIIPFEIDSFLLDEYGITSRTQNNSMIDITSDFLNRIRKVRDQFKDHPKECGYKESCMAKELLMNWALYGKKKDETNAIFSEYGSILTLIDTFCSEKKKIRIKNLFEYCTTLLDDDNEYDRVLYYFNNQKAKIKDDTINERRDMVKQLILYEYFNPRQEKEF